MVSFFSRKNNVSELFVNNSVLNLHFMKISTEIDNNFGYEKITQLVDNIPLNNMSTTYNIYLPICVRSPLFKYGFSSILYHFFCIYNMENVKLEINRYWWI